MKARHDSLRILTRGGMELSWRYAWAVFLTLSVTHRIFPLLPAVGAFAMGAALTRLSADRNWQRYQAILLQAAGFFLCALLILYPGHSRGFPFFSLYWLGDLFLGPKTLLQGSTLLLLLLCQLLIWRGGQVLAKNPNDYDSVCMQFDKGLGLFFLLLVVKSLIELRAGLVLQTRAFTFLALAFLIFSLVSIGLARNRRHAQKSLLAGYHVVGLFLSISTMAVLLGAGTTLLVFPYLHHLADLLQSSLGQAAGPVLPVLIRIILFFFKPKAVRLGPAPPLADGPSLDGIAPAPADGGETLLTVIIGWGSIAVVGLVAAGILGFLLKKLFAWLLGRNPRHEASSLHAARFAAWLRTLAYIPLRAWIFMVSRFKGHRCATSVYAAMLRWGRRSGVAMIRDETPAEYGSRLTRHFPKLSREIGLIVEAFNREVYGQIEIDDRILSRIVSAQSTMKRIRYWPKRAGIWFVR